MLKHLFYYQIDTINAQSMVIQEHGRRVKRMIGIISKEQGCTSDNIFLRFSITAS